MSRDRQPRTFEDQRNIVNVRNATSMTIPPYACMIIAGEFTDPEIEGVGYEVRQCTEEDEQAQNKAKVLFGWHLRIAPNGRGQASETCPAEARIGGPELTLPPVVDGMQPNAEPTDESTEPMAGEPVGPTRGSWELWRGGRTHLIKRVQIIGVQRYAIVEPYTGKAVFRCPDEEETEEEAETESEDDEGADSEETDSELSDIANLQIRNRETGMFEDAMAGDQQLEIKVFHDGNKNVNADGIGTASLEGSQWIVSQGGGGALVVSRAPEDIPRSTFRDAPDQCVIRTAIVELFELVETPASVNAREIAREQDEEEPPPEYLIEPLMDGDEQQTEIVANFSPAVIPQGEWFLVLPGRGGIQFATVWTG